MLLAAAGALRLFDLAWLAVACLAPAMGMVNAAIEGRGGAVVGVTYMTGTLVHMGQKIANALRGDGAARWFRSEERRVGKEGVRTFRYRWSPLHIQKKHNM